MRIVFGVVWLLTLMAEGSIAAADSLDTEAILREVEEVTEVELDRDQLASGEILTIVNGKMEVSEDELASAAFMYLPVPIGRLRESMATGWHYTDGTVVAEELKSPDQPVSVIGLSRPLSDKEIRNLKDARPGDRFNFSAAELAMLSEAEDLTAALNQIITERHRAYRANGLNGIAPYQRSRAKSYSAAGALIAATESISIIESRFPTFHGVLRNFPQGDAPNMRHRFFAIEQDVEGRRNFVLNHWLVDATDERILVAERHYYVSNSYNVLQIFFVCLPYRDGVLIAMLNQTFTEQVTGLTAGIAHKIGRGMIADEIKAIFRQVETKVIE